ncbi:MULTISPECIES: DUF6250 domain-containing protein [unclassified Brevundimonas]|uniref:DUF6250 domain-containing protein n=1 Tax=unclassified Brevundimonas TaxID=2622653 RepID=UPI0025C4DF43|nr:MULTISPECIES: DUF6250 domain-containing protein [unclassified Brevundimonas]
MSLSRRLALLGAAGLAAGCATAPRIGSKTGPRRLYADDFRRGLDQWLIELEQGRGTVSAADGVMTFDVPLGASAWFRRELTSPVEIRFTAMAVSAGGAHDRVSDLNCFWMADDPRSPGDLLARPRSGAFADYDVMRTYYVGLGGNSNTSSRFRRYVGNGERPLLPQHDLSAPDDLIVANRPYRIRLIADGGRIEYWRDDRRLFALDDPAPYRRGWFALRTTWNHMTVRDFSVWTVA